MNEKLKVFYWADFELEYSKHLINRLEACYPEFEFVIIEDVIDLLDGDIDLSAFDMGFLQCTDVTKFSSNLDQIEQIGKKLDDFVDSGKKLVVTHDIIYRRTRNKVLQKMFNYEILNFSRQAKITYNKTNRCKNMRAFKKLPDVFDLNDGELCWGEAYNTQDKIVFFEAKVEGKQLSIPVVFGKLYRGDGQLIYLNTGDTFSQPPVPIVECNQFYVDLVGESLRIDLHDVDKQIDTTEYFKQMNKCNFSKPFTFVSYCSKNTSQVYPMCVLLDKYGLNYFVDKMNITSNVTGKGWMEAVEEALDNPNCKNAIFFVSEDFLNSSECLMEIGKIKENGIHPIIFNLESDPQRLLNIIRSWSPLDDEEKILAFKEFFTIKKDEATKELKMTQLVFPCDSNFNCMHNEQVIHSLNKVCGLDIKNDERLDKFIKEVTIL